jgi:hypothetical protein
MKASHYLASLFATLILLCLLHTLAFVYQLGGPVRASYWQYGFLTAKRYVLEKANTDSGGKPKLVVLSGSNGWFGVDSKLLSEGLGIRAVNAGTNYNLAIAFMAQIVEPYLRPHDVVVLPLEYELYRRPAYGLWFTHEQMAWNPEHFWQINGFDKLKFLKSVPPERILAGTLAQAFQQRSSEFHHRVRPATEDVRTALQEMWNTLDVLPLTQRFGVYSYLNVNRDGDALIGLGTMGPGAAHEDYGLRKEFVESTDNWDALHAFVQRCRSRHIRVYVTWPSVVKNPDLDFTSPAVRTHLQAIIDRLTSMDIPILGTPEEFAYDSELMADTYYHLNPRGKAERTRQLIFLLKRELESEIPTKGAINLSIAHPRWSHPAT